MQIWARFYFLNMQNFNAPQISASIQASFYLIYNAMIRNVTVLYKNKILCIKTWKVHKLKKTYFLPKIICLMKKSYELKIFKLRGKMPWRDVEPRIFFCAVRTLNPFYYLDNFGGYNSVEHIFFHPLLRFPAASAAAVHCIFKDLNKWTMKDSMLYRLAFLDWAVPLRQSNEIVHFFCWQ